MICYSARLFAVGFATLLLILNNAGSVRGQMRIIAPSEARGGDGDLGFEVNIPPEGGSFVRAHSLYLASDFEALPEGGAWIVGYGERADALQEAGFTVTSTDLQITLGTTAVSSLSGTLDDNFNDDRTVVFEAASSTVTYPVTEANPNPFALAYEFDTPYFYNPAEGNLLVEYIEGGVTGDDWIVDFQSVSHVGDAVAFSPNGTAAFMDQASLVVEFVFMPVPEASGRVLLATSLVAALRFRRRKVKCCLPNAESYPMVGRNCPNLSRSLAPACS